MLHPKDREAKILSEFDEIEATHGVTIERDTALISEVVAITENPKALLGTFDELFLELPPESWARLADGLFFYRNDLKNGLSIAGLEKVQFIDGLGTLADKIEREKNIANYLLNLYIEKLEIETGKNKQELEILMDKAVGLAKADLMSEMVYEFTELQGLMGYYYAKALGEDELVYNAIKEQYMPLGEGGELPTSIFSSIVSMSIKLDTLIGLFSVGKRPTGSKDPFALNFWWFKETLLY